MSLEDKIVLAALTPAAGTEIRDNVFVFGSWGLNDYETSSFTVWSPPLPPIGRWPEDSFVFEDERGLLHYTRPDARPQADTEQGGV